MANVLNSKHIMDKRVKIYKGKWAKRFYKILEFRISHTKSITPSGWMHLKHITVQCTN